jgi:site-specific DNA-cytosine methylase
VRLWGLCRAEHRLRRQFAPDDLRVCGIAALTVDDLPREAVDLCWVSPPCVGFSEAGDKQGFDEKQSSGLLVVMEIERSRGCRRTDV